VSDSAVLYVKSEKVEQVEYTVPNWGHYCSAGYRASKTDFVLNEEEQKAVEVLEKTRLPYTLIDLGLANVMTRIKAKIEGVNSTPTLVFKGQKFKGLSQIMKIVEIIANV